MSECIYTSTAAHKSCYHNCTCSVVQRGLALQYMMSLPCKTISLTANMAMALIAAGYTSFVQLSIVVDLDLAICCRLACTVHIMLDQIILPVCISS